MEQWECWGIVGKDNDLLPYTIRATSLECLEAYQLCIKINKNIRKDLEPVKIVISKYEKP